MARDDSEIGASPAKDEQSRWLRWRNGELKSEGAAEVKPRRKSFFTSMSLPPESELLAIRSECTTEADGSSTGSADRSVVSDSKQPSGEHWIRRTWNSLRLDRAAEEADRLRIEAGSTSLQSALAVSRVFDELLDEVGTGLLGVWHREAHSLFACAMFFFQMLGEAFANEGLEYVPPPPLSTPQLQR